MRLAEIKIENFRSFLDETIRIDNYTCLVGPNGCGKSTLLTALNLFFRNPSPNINLSALSKDDFHHGDTSKPIKITLTFDNLSVEAQTDLKNYYRNGKLVVSAVASWDDATQSAQVLQVGSREIMADFKSYFAMEKAGVKVGELKAAYTRFREKYSDLPSVSTKDDMRTALQAYEEQHPEYCELAESSDEFYGFTRGSGRLSKYIQWIYIPAVKDVSTEQDESKKTALGQLLERTVRTKVDFQEHISQLRKEIIEKYEKIVEAEKGALTSLSESLTQRLQDWSHPRAKVDVSWNYDKEKSVSILQPAARACIGEDNFIGEIIRLGHGLQRAFLITLLQELSNSSDSSGSKLILGFEEPELYQHPPQARYMQTVLEKLSEQNTQLIVTTHSPYFVPGKGFQSVRMMKKDSVCKTTVRHLSLEELEQKLSDALGAKSSSPSSRIAAIEQIMQPSLKELFFTSNAILVEGVEDVAFITTYMELLGLFPDFRRYECHFITTGGKTNMSRPLAIAHAFGIKAFSIFDGDVNQTQPENIKTNTRDNSCLLKLSGMKSFDPLSKEVIWGKDIVMWPISIQAEIKNDIKKEKWDTAEAEVRKENEWQEVSGKNSLLIAATLEKLWEKGTKSAILEKLCRQIIAFAKS